jgi:Homing endonuclease associated repeat
VSKSLTSKPVRKTRRTLTKEEVIEAIKKLAQKLGRVPLLRELLNTRKVSLKGRHRTFVTYRNALLACSLEPPGRYKITLKELFQDWAQVALKVGKIPTIAEFEAHAKYSHQGLVKHFGGWRQVPAGLLQFSRENGLEREMKDAVELLKLSLQPRPRDNGAETKTGFRAYRPRFREDEAIYGAPLFPAPLAMAPTNEMGVLFLFAAEARNLGFRMLRVQAGFPDGEAFREVRPGQWQRVRIEFEYESRNFLAHMHPISGCEMIVCWKNNWPECPLEVLELSKIFPELA